MAPQSSSSQSDPPVPPLPPPNPVPIQPQNPLLQAPLQGICPAASETNILVGSEPKDTTIEAQPSRWSSLLKSPPPSAGSEKMMFLKPQFVNGHLVLNDDMLEEGAKEWQNRIVGYFLDNKLAFTVVKEVVQRRWKMKGEVHIGLDGDMYYFTFSNEEDRSKILDEGPFFISGKLFQAWSRDVEESRGTIESVPIWVKMWNVLKHMWNPNGLSSIASVIGNPKCMDKATEENKMLSFARISVEVKPDKELPNSITMKTQQGRELEVYFESAWRPLICTNCKIFGHSDSTCPKKKIVDPMPVKEVAWNQAQQNFNKPNNNRGGAGPSRWKPTPGRGKQTYGGKRNQQNTWKPTNSGNNIALRTSNKFDCLEVVAKKEPIEVHDPENDAVHKEKEKNKEVAVC